MALDLGANFKITAGVQGQAQMDRFNASLRDADKNGGLLTNSMASLKGAMAGLTIAAVGVTLVSMTKAAIDNADALNEMAERTGVAGDKLSELQYAAELNGASLEEVEVALKKVSSKAFDAATGNKAAADTFNALGISVQGLDGKLKTSDDLFQEIADVLNTVEDRTTRTALAVEIFGRSGASLIPLMENMRDSREEAKRLGVVVGVEMQQAADEFNDNLTRMQFQAKAFATSLANEVLPTLNRFLSELTAGREVFGGYWEALKQIGTTNPFNSVAENAEKYRGKVASLSAEIEKISSGQNKWFGKDTAEGKQRVAELNAELENTKKLVDYFQRMNGQTSTAGAGRGSVNPPMVGGGGDDILARLKAANEKADKPGAAKESEFERLKRQYEDQALRVRDLGEAERLLQEIQLGRFKSLTPEQQKELEAMARSLDYQKQMAEGQKVMDERQRKMAGDRATASQREQEDMDRTIQKWEEIADPAKRYREEIEKVQEAFQKGLINSDVASKTVDHLNEQIEALGKVKDKGKSAMEELTDAVNGWGKQATEAFIDFAFTGKMSFGDLATSVLKDMARMIAQQQIMGPLMNAVGGGSGGAFAGLTSLFGFANGGIMTGGGSMPLNKYANGGVARSPQLAMFGEGSRPEAYVPLPDGRTIPVTMQGQGGGGSMSVVVNVNATTGQTDEQGGGKLSQLGNIIAAAVQKELVNQKRPGGLLSAA